MKLSRKSGQTRILHLRGHLLDSYVVKNLYVHTVQILLPGGEESVPVLVKIHLSFTHQISQNQTGSHVISFTINMSSFQCFFPTRQQLQLSQPYNPTTRSRQPDNNYTCPPWRNNYIIPTRQHEADNLTTISKTRTTTTITPVRRGGTFPT